MYIIKSGSVEDIDKCGNEPETKTVYSYKGTKNPPLILSGGSDNMLIEFKLSVKKYRLNTGGRLGITKWVETSAESTKVLLNLEEIIELYRCPKKFINHAISVQSAYVSIKKIR